MDIPVSKYNVRVQNTKRKHGLIPKRNQRTPSDKT